uniref:Uncharacterized protein n=1 Tax=Macrostomum lignano TaxID=282301 RepID=A0A1I8FGH6_9PLAT
MTLTQTATSVPLAWISRFELLNWMAKLSSCRSGTPAGQERFRRTITFILLSRGRPTASS